MSKALPAPLGMIPRIAFDGHAWVFPTRDTAGNAAPARPCSEIGDVEVSYCSSEMKWRGRHEPRAITVFVRSLENFRIPPAAGITAVGKYQSFRAPLWRLTKQYSASFGAAGRGRDFSN
jgi:hypothetical protein